MLELLEVHDLNNNLIGIKDRKEFYEEVHKEYAATGKISHKVKSVRVLVMSSEGRIYLQKRSTTKVDNAGLYDKTVCGHISQGESPTIAVIRECAEELGFPAVVLSPEEFETSIHSTDLSVIGILRQMEEDRNFLSVRKTKQGDFIQPFISYFYIGYYDGSIKFKDGESSGIETFSIKELENELTDNANKFTQDIHFMIDRFKNHLRPL